MSNRKQAEQLLESWLYGRPANTIRAYRADLAHFQKFTQTDSPEAAVEKLLSWNAGMCHEMLSRFKNDLAKKRAPNSVNRVLAALVSMLEHGRSIGATTLDPSIKRVKAEATKSTEGPPVEQVLQVLADLKRQGEGEWRRASTALRDRAAIALMLYNGLRISEVLGLRMEDVGGDSISILAKGRTQRQRITLAVPSKEALNDWLARRGDQAGWVFTSWKKGGINAERAADRHTMWVRVNSLGLLRNHGIRHTAAVLALAATKGNISAVQKFLRHASPITTSLYLVSSEDAAGDVAAALTALTSGGEVPEKKIVIKQPAPHVPLKPVNMADAVKQMLAALFDGDDVTKQSRANYRSVLNHLARWLGVDSIETAVEYLLVGDNEELRLLMRDYREQRLETASAHTVNRCVEVIALLLKHGRRLGLHDLVLDLKSLPEEVEAAAQAS